MTSPFQTPPFQTSPFDYHQQVYVYFQAWRQLLQSLAVMTGGMPFPGAPWTTPVIPPYLPAAQPYPSAGPMNPPTDAADYTQQLFGQLQAWRQHLEQSAATPPPAPDTSPGRPHRPAPVNPDRGEGAGRSPYPAPSGGYANQPGGSESTWPPKNLAVRPLTESGTQWPVDFGARENSVNQVVSPWNEELSDHAPRTRSVQAARAARGEQVVQTPNDQWVSESGTVRLPRLLEYGPPAAQTRASAAAARQAAPDVSARAAVRSPLFRGLAERAQLKQNLG
ncbi:MAG: hypothetical protein JWR11_5012 [Mycobacterium sp.]|nr:hypothetical protein [Mycobacterium sp.]